MSDDATMTTSEVQTLLGVKSAAAARVQIARMGLRAVGRDTDTGEKLWNREQVEAANANRPRRGARTDITRRRAEGYMTRHRNPGEPVTGPFDHYELHAPTGTYNHVTQIVNASTERIHALVTETTGQPYVTIAVYNYGSAVALACELLIAGIQLIPADPASRS